MRRLRAALIRIAALFRARAADGFADELDSHLQSHIDDNVRAGMTLEQARRDALLKLGGRSVAAEAWRERHGLPSVESFAQDVRFALRTLRRNPGFASAATATLALGIGAVTIMFAVVSGVLLTPVPYPQPDRLVRLQERTVQATQFGNLWAFSYLNFLDCRRDSQSLIMGVWRSNGGIVSAPGPADYVDAREVSADLFAILGVHYAQGRGFIADEDQPSAAPVAIISHGLWQSRFQGADAIGSRLTFNGHTYTIVGVTAADSSFAADVFTPIGQDSAPYMRARQAHPGLQVWARLRSGRTLEAARTELSVIGNRLAGQYPDSNTGRTFVAEPLRPFVGDVGSTLWLLLGAVAVVLLIACANIASLLLARAVSRERELAMRSALGASRTRLARQCLTESGVLGVVGGLLGVALAAAGIRPFVALWPGALPRADFVHLDWRVLLFALGVSMASSLIFGIAPALRAPTDVDRALRVGGRAIGGSRRLHSAFVVSEIALAIVLLVAAGMFGRTLLRLSSLDPGVDVSDVLVARVGLSSSTLNDPAAIRAAWADVMARVRRLPGVQAVATLDTVPMREGNNQLGYWTSAALPPRNEQPLALATSVTPGYLETMRLPLRQGRFFDDHDRLGAEPVIVIDEVLARHAFGEQDAVGRQLWVPDMGERSLRVIGVVAHVRHWGLAGDDDARVRAQLYYPFAQVPDRLTRRWSELMSIAVRSSVSPLTIVDQIRNEVRGAANDQVLYEVRTMDQLASGSLSQHRFLLQLFAIFAAVALVLASVGLYGVLSYLVGRRKSEMGVRMALGASATDVVWLVLRESLVMVATGFVVGICAGLAGVRLLDTLITGMRPPDVQTFVAVSAILGVAALSASVLPAWRATRVDPIVALRTE
jgi:putative ABC transport system permease protein